MSIILSITVIGLFLLLRIEGPRRLARILSVREKRQQARYL